MISEEKEFAVCMKQLKEQISALSNSRIHKESSAAIAELTSSLFISNQDIKYQLLHGADFRDMLDPRDQVLEHSFSFKEVFSEKDLEELGTNFVDSKLFEKILGKIKIFLVETVSNIVSISFKFMCKG